MTRISKSTILKAAATTFACVAASMLACDALVPLMGGSFDGVGFWMSLICPLVAAGTMSTWQFHQSEKYRLALDEIVSMHAELDRMHRQLRETHQALQQRSRTDSMTGAMVRDAFFELVEAAGAEGRTGTLLLADADHFKQINDEHGHQTGDRVLRAIGAAIAGSLRPGDSWGRIGGEEFAIFLPMLTSTRAARIADNIRASVEATIIEIPQCPLRVTISIGGVTLASGFDFNAAFSEADSMLYRAKNEGRNRIVIDGERLSQAA